jgi:hypothetical protein
VLALLCLSAWVCPAVRVVNQLLLRKELTLSQMLPMAKLIIIRNSEYVNRLRTYRIYLDGVKLGNAANGDSKEFIIAPGQHNVCARVDWYSSPMTIGHKKYLSIKEFW